MSTDREVTRIVRSWLEDGVTTLPDRVLDAVLDQVPATPQRRPWWPARRFPSMFTPVRISLAAAAVVVIAVLGINLLTKTPGVGAPSSPTPVPGSSALSGAACPSVALLPQVNVSLGGSMELCAENSTADFNWVWFRGQPGWTLNATDSGSVAYSLAGDSTAGFIEVIRPGSIVEMNGTSSPVPDDLMAWLQARPDLALGASTPLTVGSGSGAIAEGTVRAGSHVTSRGVVTIACQAGLAPCTFDNPSALGVAANAHFELAVLKDGSQQFLVELSADASSWATAKSKLEGLLAVMTFPHPTG